MSAAVSDLYCHACSRLYANAEFPPAFNEEDDRICPQCSSEFVELREPQAAPAPSTGATAGIFNGLGANTSRRVFTTPNGLNMELHVTTAVLPPEMYDMLSQSGSQGVSMVFSVDNAGALVPAGNLRGLTFGDAEFEALLDRLAQQYRPPMQPTSQQVINALPRRRVQAQGDDAAAAAAGDVASCRPGEPCSVCHEEFGAGTSVVELPCQHCFHEDCILPWLREHNTCPVCRFKLDEDTTTTSGTSGSQRPADPPPNEADEMSWIDRYLAPRRPRAPRSSRGGGSGSAAGDASPGMGGSSQHPVRSSSGAASVRSGPYTRQEEAGRVDAASSRGATAQDARSDEPSTASQEVNELVNRIATLTTQRQAISDLAGRISSLTQQSASSQQAIDDLTSRIGSISQRHASNQQAFQDLVGDILRLMQRRQSLMGNTQELQASHRHLRERMEALLQQSQAPRDGAGASSAADGVAGAAAQAEQVAALQESMWRALQQGQASSSGRPGPSSSSSTNAASRATATRGAAGAGSAGSAGAGAVQRQQQAEEQQGAELAASADGLPGSHMGEWELRAFEQDISRAAALAESILSSLPQGAAAAAAGPGAAAAGAAASRAAPADPALPEAAAAAAGGAGTDVAASAAPSDEVVIVAVGDAQGAAVQQARAMRAPLLVRVVGNVLRWAVRSVGRLFGLGR